MSGTPEIATRAEQPYVAIRAQVTMAELGGLAARFGEVFGWLGPTAPRLQGRRFSSTTP